MKDKLNKTGRKHLTIFNLNNLLVVFFAFSLAVSVAIPTYITISNIEAASAKENDPSKEEGTDNGGDYTYIKGYLDTTYR